MTPLPSLIQFPPLHKLIRVKNHDHIPYESLNHKYFTHADDLQTKFANQCKNADAMLFSFAIVQMFGKFSKQCLVKDIC